MPVLAFIDLALKIGKPIAQIPAVGRLINKTLDDGKKEVSKTKAGVLLGMGVGVDWPELMAGVLAKDPAAIGRLVMLILSYALALIGYETATKGNGKSQ